MEANIRFIDASFLVLSLSTHLSFTPVLFYFSHSLFQFLCSSTHFSRALFLSFTFLPLASLFSYLSHFLSSLYYPSTPFSISHALLFSFTSLPLTPLFFHFSHFLSSAYYPSLPSSLSSQALFLTSQFHITSAVFQRH